MVAIVLLGMEIFVLARHIPNVEGPNCDSAYVQKERGRERFGGRGVGSEAWGLEVLD